MYNYVGVTCGWVDVWMVGDMNGWVVLSMLLHCGVRVWVLG